LMFLGEICRKYWTFAGRNYIIYAMQHYVRRI